MARKNEFCGYRFCPLCASELLRGIKEGGDRLYCPDEECGWVFYQNPVPAAGAIVVENDRVLLVKRAHPPRIGWWCIPAGFMEWREHPSQTAIRELEEETGLRVKLTSFFEVYSGTDDPRNNAVLMLYLADRISGELRASDDAQDVRFFSFDNLPEAIAFDSHIQALADYQRRFRS
ncbi:NUDIX domain-containing protein [candidate division GN15 bacterium]|nr:NUDIX domain-containing protein [candidate division GN15 bacterium]